MATTTTKALPTSKKGSPINVLLLLGILAVGLLLYFYYQNPALFGMTKPLTNGATSSLANALNAGQPDVIGKPLLTAKQIDAIFKAAGSPAAGTGQALYDGSVKSGVNDAFAMGVFYAESRYGTLGAATGNKSISNFILHGSYKVYPTWADGYTDFYQSAKLCGQDNVQAVINCLYQGTYLSGNLSLEAPEPDVKLILSTMKKLGA